MENDDQVTLLVDEYKHGGVHYSIANSRDYPDRRWDVATRGVFVPCDHLQTEYQYGRKTMQEIERDSGQVLDEYSRWCNGEVYGVVTESYRLESDSIQRQDVVSCWDHVGREYAERSEEHTSELQSLMR